MLSATNYAQNYAGIIGKALLTMVSLMMWTNYSREILLFLCKPWLLDFGNETKQNRVIEYISTIKRCSEAKNI